MEKLKIPYPIIVEGKYDKIKLDSLLDAEVFTTDGFGIFSNEEKLSLINRLSEKRGKIIILTDSDGGGTLIRSHLKTRLAAASVINLYVPAVKGKEKRKTSPSKEGLLGVEGTDKDIILRLLSPFATNEPIKDGGITKTDLYLYGFTGTENSSLRREKLLERLNLPNKITPNALISVLNVLYTKEEFENICKEI